MLTRKQHELLVFIQDRLARDGVSPSFDEMKEALGLKSKSGIHRLITALEERGFIRRLAHRARALEVVRVPEADRRPARRDTPAGRAVPPAAPAPLPFPRAAARPASDVVALPLYGRIAAGTPIEALRDTSNSVEVPAGMLAGGEHYALEVAGDSMVDEGILDGDTILVRRCDTAENGAIVVALVDEGEVTLKRLQRRGATIDLVPANAAHTVRSLAADRVQVQGRLVGLIRRYH